MFSTDNLMQISIIKHIGISFFCRLYCQIRFCFCKLYSNSFIVFHSYFPVIAIENRFRAILFQQYLYDMFLFRMFCLNFQGFIVHYPCIFYRKSFLFKNILHCFRNRDSRIIINTAIQFQIILIIKCIIVTIFCSLNSKILFSHLICNLHIIHIQSIFHFFHCFVYFRVQPATNLFILMCQFVYSIFTYNKINALLHVFCILNAKHFFLMIWNFQIFIHGIIQRFKPFNLNHTFCIHIFHQIIIVNIMEFRHS